MPYNFELQEIALKIAWHYLGIPYRWGGDDPIKGFDCSGVFNEILQSVGLIRRYEDLTAQGIWDRFKDKKIDVPQEGALVFYGADDKHITHIEMCINNKLSIGASGGGSKTLTLEDAILQNAFIKIRPIQSRKDIVGFIDPFKE